MNAGSEVYNHGMGKGTDVLEVVAASEKASAKVSFWNQYSLCAIRLYLCLHLPYVLFHNENTS